MSKSNFHKGRYIPEQKQNEELQAWSRREFSKTPRTEIIAAAKTVVAYAETDDSNRFNSAVNILLIKIKSYHDAQTQGDLFK
jgi:FtsZ-interacting cell division protein YlmF